MKKIIAISLLALIVLSGCQTLRTKMKAWVGHHQSELIADWGPPNNITTDGKDGTVLDYSRVRQTGGVPIRQKDGSYIYTPQWTKKTIIAFYVNPDGVIYNYKLR